MVLTLKAPESTVELAICLALKARGYDVLKVPRAGYYDAGKKIFRKHANPFALNGFPDLLIFDPKKLRGFFVGLEVKSEKGKLSDAQEEMRDLLRRGDALYYIVRSVEDAVGSALHAESVISSRLGFVHHSS
jgi:hypothetical protein